MKNNNLATVFIGLVLSGKIAELINDCSLPNIPFPTAGGKVFWEELASCQGWRLQKNIFTKHCRILDPDDIRRAWGGEQAMLQLFERMNNK